MVHRRKRIIALLTAAVLLLQCVQVGVMAQDNTEPSGTTSAPVETVPETQPETTDPSSEAEWEGTGALNPDGTPVTSDQGDVPQEGEPEVTEPPAEPESYIITLDLDGGQVNNLQSFGWSQSSYEKYQWTRTASESQAGSGVAMMVDETLGGLLPGAPYRAGYQFIGWKIDGVDHTGDTVTIYEDTEITACWDIEIYQVEFRQDSNRLWQVQVPYGATLWTESSAPWEEPGVQWTEDKAQVYISVGQNPAQNVTVTRNQSGNLGSYYYTFTLGGVYYFTYGGKTPTKPGQHFVSWKLLSGGAGFTVTGNAVFTSQFQADTAYVFNIYYYYENGTRAKETATFTFGKNDIADGKITIEVTFPQILHYTASLNQRDGVIWNEETDTIEVDVDTAFPTTSATNFLALTVIYSSAEISYKVEYYQQTADGNAYVYVGTLENFEKVKYGSRVSVPDSPELGQDVSFEGFSISASSQSAISGGVVLQEPIVEFDKDGNAIVKVYYDRASYFIYFQTGTTEVQLEPEKVRYGAKMPDLSEKIASLTRQGYDPVTKDNITWYRLNENGELQKVEVPNQSDPIYGFMPPYDLYAVFTWIPATTSVRLVYWVESRNSPGYQNAYTVTVNGIQTEAVLTVNLNEGVTITGGGWPADKTGASGFSDLMESRYEDEAYATFFSYNDQQTKASPGNVANAQATDTGAVSQETITADSFNVKVSGDGTTTINIYYTRNLYTLEFVLARRNGSNQLQVAWRTNGSFAGTDTMWTTGVDGSLSFLDFGEDVTTQSESASEMYGDLSVQKTYRLTDSLGVDDRSPVGRYGTKRISMVGTDYLCYVYTLTARFEADITALWPTAGNLTDKFTTTDANNATQTYEYISVGTDKNSYYQKVFTEGSGQHNILNAYSTMDLNVVAMGNENWTATADTGDGEFAHRMVAYWYYSAKEYHYYFFYETVDASIKPQDPQVQEFSVFQMESPGATGYVQGSLLTTSADNYGHVYVYDENYSVQFSSSDKAGQNQPARQGFVSQFKISSGAGTDKGGNIYFFYTREEYKLDIQNTNERYELPEDILTERFDCLSKYGQGITTLQQLGWERINEDGTATIRFGGALVPLAEEEITTWLTSEDGGRLKYPNPSSGENQYYFRMWYRNLMQTIPVDWTPAGGLQTMTANTTLYAGWFTPRYTTTYVLNGGTWKDKIQYTLTTYTDPSVGTLFLYYPHQTAEAEAGVPMYWYLQTKAEDRLFVQNLYTCELSDVAMWDEATQHYIANGKITSLEDLLAISELHNHQSRLVNQYYCYMGEEGTYNHRNYININAQVNTVLPEPAAPERVGYSFAGWYYFDAEPSNGQKVYLKDVLSQNQSLASYGENYVYLDHVGDAYLVHVDDQEQLFYYPDQTGYRYSYTNDASVVSRDLRLYAAWEPQGDVKAEVYHLVPVDEVQDNQTFTPKDGQPIAVNKSQQITIGGKRYYILDSESLSNLYTGSTYIQTAWQYCKDDTRKNWLPVQAEIPLHADNRTQTVTEQTLDTVTGNTYRIADGDGTYTYYAFFVYEPTDLVTYQIYAIDLSVAVAEGDLKSYQDTFDRSFRPEPTEPYCLSITEKQISMADAVTTFVTENAPAISGYSVYQDWSQELQLQTDSDANNIFFYYVRDNDAIDYSVTFYLMNDGGYSGQNAVTISGIPAVTGEIISLEDMASFYAELLTTAKIYSGYAGSENQAQQDLYNRYEGMTITWIQNGIEKKFTVLVGDTDDLNLDQITNIPLDYYVDSWSPTGTSLVVSDGVQVAVYLATAHLVIQKVDTAGLPLSGAKFTLERLVEDAGGEISYDGKTYRLDPDFAPMTATSGADGKAWFHDLSARLFEGGKGYVYRLTETEAPKGYHRLTAPMYVITPYTVEDETSYTVTYTVVNSGLLTMPASGLPGGIYPMTFLGFGLMTGALLWWYVSPKGTSTNVKPVDGKRRKAKRPDTKL